MNEDHLRVVVSGSEWLGSGLGSIESALYQLFTQATDEVIIVAYTVSAAAPLLFQQLEIMLQRGIRIRFLINRFPRLLPYVQQQFQVLHSRFPSLFQLYTFTPRHDEADLHAKLVIVDRRIALVGSANLSLRGLMDNHELGILIEGKGVAEVIKAVDLLLISTQVASVFTIT